MKTSYLTILSLLLLLALSSCESTDSSTTEENLIQYIPASTALIVRTNNLNEWAEQLARNPFINSNKKLPVNEIFKKAFSLYAPIKPQKLSLLCFSRIGRNDIKSTLITSDSLSLSTLPDYKAVKSYPYDGQTIQPYTFQGITLYATKLNNIHVLGESKLVVENMIRLFKEKLASPEDFSKIQQAISKNRESILINTTEFGKIFSQFFPGTNLGSIFSASTRWAALDIDLKSNGIYVRGSTFPSNKEILGLFKNTKPLQNKIAAITPLGASGFTSFTYDDFKPLAENLSFYRKQDLPQTNEELLSSVTEVGVISNQKNKSLIITPIEGVNIEDYLLKEENFIKDYRSHKIYSFSDPNYFYRMLNPLIQLRNLKFVSKIKNFYAFANQQSTLEDLIANVQNKTVFTSSKSYRDFTKKLDDKSSLLAVGNTKNILKGLSKEEKNTPYENTDTKGFNYEAIQFINHDNYIYINGAFEKSVKENVPRGSIQTNSLAIGEDISHGPWFFENWRTHRQDIAVQGKSNTLYLFNLSGKLLWKRQLDGPILGKIQPIDIYQNGRKQMAFVTPQTFYIVDREGNIVKPYQKTFKNTITQPLALFDYNHNGRFRFLIIQGKNLTMLDKNLKVVSGFKFTKAQSEILQPPKHFRLGAKDYIVIPEQSGKLHILNPRGETRVPVKNKISFSKNKWFLYQNQFTSTDQKGRLIQITPQGKVSTTDLKLSEIHKIYATAKTLVTFSDNKLTIKGKTIKLDYGLYTAPKIFYLNNKIYVAITDRQAHKVYLFDSNSELINGFPVYGNSAVDLKKSGNATSPLKLVVQGEKDRALIYNVN